MNASVSGGPIGIVVVNYASHEVIERNLGSIDLADAQAAVVIVDNFSSAAEADAARELADRHGWSHVALAGNRMSGPRQYAPHVVRCELRIARQQQRRNAAGMRGGNRRS